MFCAPNFSLAGLAIFCKVPVSFVSYQKTLNKVGKTLFLRLHEQWPKVKLGVRKIDYVRQNSSRHTSASLCEVLENYPPGPELGQTTGIIK